MRVLLVGPDLEANLSLLYLAASLRRAGHAATIARFDGPQDAAGVLAAAREADLVGLSMSFQVRAAEFLELAAALKRAAPDRPVVAGGHHASCAARELLEDHPALDAIVLHEGEETIVELAELGEGLAARASEVRGVASRRDGQVHVSPPRPIVADLDRLPRPDRSGPARLLSHLDQWGTAGVGAGAAVLVNNLPAASLLAARPPAHPYSLLVGLNLGPNLFVTGSLAWFLWLRAARRAGAEPSIREASRVGLVAVPLSIVVAVALLVLTGSQ